MSSDTVPDQQAMDAFLAFFKNEIHTPPKVSELFKVPEGLAPDWQRIFDRVVAHYERECAANRHSLIALEKRSWIMEDEELSEIEMVMSSAKAKQKGNEAFKLGDFTTAFMYYMFAIQTFPTPDVMNNAAACALQLSRFDLAEKYARQALEMDLFTNPTSIVKARFRRSIARLHLGKFAEALEDCEAALVLNPTDTSVSNLMATIRDTMNNIDTEAKLTVYLEQQPKPTAPISWQEGMFFPEDGLDTGYIRIPETLQAHTMANVEAPTF